ncbi:hypothetical protein C0971_16240 [Bacillus methanolicus]|uniref:zeta toxin family protein n=1 Tax=Bacillus methanolicus TaxID=1471 RepID=UPI00200E8539|nr:zeta toxin family protein [Bacillus methanolicus]UQD53396.1 hypothetical protein C0971_16240 [Bacillus methanolicus]
MSKKEKTIILEPLSKDDLDPKTRIQLELQNNEITVSQALIKLSDTAKEFYHTNLGKVFVTITINDVEEHIAVDSEKFANWLRKEFFMIANKPPSSTALKEAISTILATKEFELTAFHPVYIRVGQFNKNVYIDLCNDKREIVEITSDGWSIIEKSPVKFYRSKTMQPLPRPLEEKTINELKALVNIPKENFILLVAFLLGTLKPNGSYPILILQGGQGSGKTTLASLIKKLIDPCLDSVRSLPRNEEDLMIGAQNNWILNYDNLSGITHMMADALCKMSTGGTLGRRRLFTNDEESVLSAKRPQILNGIDYIAKRPDLQDRSIILHLPRIPDFKRNSEQSIWDVFKKLHPYILGALFNLVSNAIKYQGSIKLTKIPRMADFAKWASTLDISLKLGEGAFLNFYTKNRRKAAQEAVEQDLLAYSIMNCLAHEGQIKGNASFILTKLMNYLPPFQKASGKPIVPINRFKDEIERILPLLEANGVKYDYRRNSHERTHLFTLPK